MPHSPCDNFDRCERIYGNGIFQVESSERNNQRKRKLRLDVIPEVKLEIPSFLHARVREVSYLQLDRLKSKYRTRSYFILEYISARKI